MYCQAVILTVHTWPVPSLLFKGLLTVPAHPCSLLWVVSTMALSPFPSQLPDVFLDVYLLLINVRKRCPEAPVYICL